MKKQNNRAKRVALYARVSTLDKGQDPQTQLDQLRDYAQRRNFEVMGEFIDYASGTTQDRVQYKLMMEAARKRKLDVVLVWRYDRFARSTQALVNAMKEFQSMGIDFISYQENIDTTTPTGELIFHVMASLAQFESSLISQRVKAGMARAKAQGKRISRPTISMDRQNEIFDLQKQGLSMNKISKQLGIAYGTVYNYLSKAKDTL
ncbi:helix-turn-helix domain-containing protein [Rudanella paleaurantiibacter]|jgi:DNA invertase Pin-like site-specific DNA recombinase|uniref:Resolvase n=5 Tax=Cytophagales TaxID=768507 RepID=A0A5R9KLX2_9BACT|nr:MULTISPECIES: recombinase family protein [Cytophagales]MBE8970156.1 recombinase family protein [Nostocales cyanobacterium LEGE 12452]KAA9341104.1 helix-turn-helix domain-containing protein [Larkinella humicola]KAB7725166.1 helix-turn-helix domain-containing protein [Rudanella paleaurantiibacter]TLU97242.1 resolvase [Dyadobacter sediminis]TLU97254.1 resolvase [Dyadobacter sediminis]